jgi:hypothetical protein
MVSDIIKASLIQERVNDMTDPKMAPMLAEIGRFIADILGEKGAEGAFMYAEAGDMWQAAGIFKDLGNQVMYRDPSRPLTSAIQDLWESADDGKKWAVLLYTISNGKFDAHFTFPEDNDPAEGSYERRKRALEERYGDKPVDYSDPYGTGARNG